MAYQWSIIGRGRMGWHAQNADDVRSQGGTFEQYVDEAAIGALVYDAAEANREAFIDFVFQGPIVCGSLPPGHMRRMGTTDIIPYDGSSGALDDVAIDVYKRLLKDRVPGILLGHVAARSATARFVDWDVYCPQCGEQYRTGWTHHLREPNGPCVPVRSVWA